MQLFQFTPTQDELFQFQPELDGSPCTAIVTWNLWGFAVGNQGAKRPYIAVYDLNGNLIVNRPLVGSPLDYDINLVARYFTTSSLVYRIDNGTIEVSP